MENIKYTADGRKVKVIEIIEGLKTEFLLEEIFVTDKNEEILSGKRFLENKVLDSPPRSWKEKQLIDLEISYEKTKKSWEEKISGLIEEKAKLYTSLKLRVKWLRDISKQPIEDDLKKILNTIGDFLSGNITYVYIEDYGNLNLIEFNENGVNKFLEQREDRYNRIENLRLLTLFGKTDGKLTFKINEYSDGSGSNKDIEFFRTKEDALAFLQTKLDAKETYCEKTIKQAKELGLILDKEKIDFYYKSKSRQILNLIKENEEQIIDLKMKLEKQENEERQYNN